MLAVFETELLGIEGVEAEPVPTQEAAAAKESASASDNDTVDVEPAPTQEAAAKESAPVVDDDTVNADNEEAPPDLPSPMDDEEDGGGECNLLGNFALLVQGALGLLAVSSLAVKRMRESPRRPVKIWFFDVSKQVFGSVLLHLANVLMSMLSSGSFNVATNVAATPKYTAPQDKSDQPNPCSFYLLNLAIDVSLVLDSMRGRQTNHTLDHHWYPNPSPTFEDSPSWIRSHAPRRSTRVHSQRQLRPAASRNLVAQTIHDLLPRSHRHEAVRSRRLCLPPMDRMGR